MTESVNSVVPECPPRSGVRVPAGHRFEDRLVDRARLRLGLRVVKKRRDRKDHRHRIRDVLAEESGRGAVWRLGHRGGRLEVLVEREQHRLGARDRAEERQHEVREEVAVAIEAWDHERLGRRSRHESRERRVDQDRLVVDVRVALGRRVHLLLQHPLVHRAHGPFGPAVDAPADPIRFAERELGDRGAIPAHDPLGAKRHLVGALALAPLLGAVRVANGHPADRDGVVDARHGRHAGNPPAGPHDHLAADRLAQDAVRAADIVGAFRGDRRRLEAQSSLGHALRRFVYDLVVRRAAVLQREVVALDLELDPKHVLVEDAKRLVEELLPRLVPVERNNAKRLHASRRLPHLMAS